VTTIWKHCPLHEKTIKIIVAIGIANEYPKTDFLIFFFIFRCSLNVLNTLNIRQWVYVDATINIHNPLTALLCFRTT